MTIGESEGLNGGAVDGTTDPYIILPQGTDCSTVVEEGSCCWDTDNDKLYCGDGTASVEVGGGGGGTDDQTIDVLSFGGTTLSISLEDDGEANQTVDLAALQDGTGTDDQTCAEVTGCVESALTVEVDGSTTNEINTIQGDDNTATSGLAISIDGAGIVTTDVIGDILTVTGTEVDGSTTNELQDLFSIIAVATQDNIAVDSNTDTLTLVGAGITAITTTAGSDTVTFTSTEVDGSTTNEVNTVQGDDNGATSGLAISIDGAGIVTTDVVGDVLTITGTEVDGSTTNEINTITAGDANATAGLAITFVDAGIITTTEAADSITITATEAQTLADVLALGADANDVSITSGADIGLDSLSSDGATIVIGLGDENTYTQTGGTSHAFALGADAGDDFTIDTTGFVYEGDNNRVGIGHSDPGVPLEVNGTIRSRVDNGTVGTLSLAGDSVTMATSVGDDFTMNVWDGADAFKAIEVDGSGHEVILSGAEGKVGIGTTTPGYKLDINNGSGESGMRLYGSSYLRHTFQVDSATNTARGMFAGNKSSGTFATPVAVDNGDYLFSILGAGYDGAGYDTDAEIDFIATETHNATSHGTKIQFQTTANGAWSQGIRMVIDHDGQVGIGTILPSHNLTVGNGATSAGFISILEDTDDGTNNATFTVPALAADTDYILPTAIGGAGEVLTDAAGNGTLSWSAASGSAGTLAQTLALGADANDVDTTSWGKMEGFDAGLYLDWDADGVIDLTSDGTLELHSSDWDISTTGVVTDVSISAANNVVEADTVLTITGLAPDTATTQATQASITTTANLTTVGALNSGSITSGFGNIDNGASTIDGGAITADGLLTASLGITMAATQDLTIGDAGEIVLDAVPASDHTGTGLSASMTVDANTYGIASALHLDTDGNWIEADANATATMPCAALALETGTGTKTVLFQGVIRNDTWAWTVGGPIYVSGTAGTLTQTAPSATGDFVQIVGYATHADRIYFAPNFMMIEIN